MSDHKPVTFLDSEGNTISNDPIYLAHQTLASAGVEVNDDGSTDAGDLQRENEELRAKLEALTAAQSQSSDDSESDSDADGDDEDVDFDALDGEALKAYAKQHGIDISGLKKVSEVREAVKAASASE